jgi:formate-dependent nitrite reductase membrane component NrfD
MFWVGAIGLGGLVPVALVWMMLSPSIALPVSYVIPAAVFALVGGFAWEYIWVDAGQAVPNS